MVLKKFFIPFSCVWLVLSTLFNQARGSDLEIEIGAIPIGCLSKIKRYFGCVTSDEENPDPYPYFTFPRRDGDSDMDEEEFQRRASTLQRDRTRTNKFLCVGTGTVICGIIFALIVYSLWLNLRHC